MAPQQNGIRNGESQPPLTPSEQEASRLRAIFKDVNLPEIVGVDLRGKTPKEIVQLLPPMGGENPVRAILVDESTGRAYGIRSGWVPDPLEIHNGLSFQNGSIPLDTADQAGEVWQSLGYHVEAQAAAFMRKMGITAAILYINAANPCYQGGAGCFFRLIEMLPEEAKLVVNNKYGESFSRKHGWPFSFVGSADESRSRP